MDKEEAQPKVKERVDPTNSLYISKLLGLLEAMSPSPLGMFFKCRFLCHPGMSFLTSSPGNSGPGLLEMVEAIKLKQACLVQISDGNLHRSFQGRIFLFTQVISSKMSLDLCLKCKEK